MAPVLGLAFIVFAIFCAFMLRPKDSLRARAQERYRRDRQATRQRDRQATRQRDRMTQQR